MFQSAPMVLRFQCIPFSGILCYASGQVAIAPVSFFVPNNHVAFSPFLSSCFPDTVTSLDLWWRAVMTLIENYI